MIRKRKYSIVYFICYYETGNYELPGNYLLFYQDNNFLGISKYDCYYMDGHTRTHTQYYKLKVLRYNTGYTGTLYIKYIKYKIDAHH